MIDLNNLDKKTSEALGIIKRADLIIGEASDLSMDRRSKMFLLASIKCWQETMREDEIAKLLPKHIIDRAILEACPEIFNQHVKMASATLVIHQLIVDMETKENAEK